MILGVSLDASFSRSTADPTLFEGNIAAAGCARKSERPVSGTFLHPLYRDVRGAHLPQDGRHPGLLGDLVPEQWATSLGPQLCSPANRMTGRD
jgi:hypothetical protein